MAVPRTFNQRLPGVVCETGLPTRASNPLRMDIAGFVGFAERGPVDVPVLIEDINQFALIFGRDFALALNDGVPVYAYLYPSVQSFFENGGKTCYVVRVTGTAASRSQIVLPGLLHQGNWQPIALAAAWVGRWSHDVQIGTQSRMTPLKVLVDKLTIDAESLVAPNFALRLLLHQGLNLHPGDVLRLRIEQDMADENARQDFSIYVTLSAVTSIDEAGQVLPSQGKKVRVTFNPRITYFATNAVVEPVVAVAQFGNSGWHSLPFDAADIMVEKEDRTYYLHLPLRDVDVDASDTIINTGDLLRLLTDTGKTIFIIVRNLRRVVVADELFWSIETNEPLQVEANLPAGETFFVRQVDLHSFDLRVEADRNVVEVWQDLRFNQRERYWADVLMPAIDRNHVHPLAFTVNDFAPYSLHIGRPSDMPDTILPIGMDVTYRYHGVTADAVGSDDLDTFEPDVVFRDAAFNAVTTYNTLNTANDMMYLSPFPRRLNGIHALLPLTDVSLLLVPDAVHTGWEQVDQPEFRLPTPKDDAPDVPDGFYDCLPEDIPEPDDDDNGKMAVINLEYAAITIEARYAHLPTQVAPALYDVQPLLALQQSMVHFCAARADCVAIFSLPRHLEQSGIDEWHDELTVRFQGTTNLSFAAVYHGWVGVRETAIPMLRPVRYMPPGGVVCGMIAEREIRRGVWIAPANMPLRTVVHIQPDIAAPDWAHYYNLQLNIIRQFPGHYALRSALTLSPDRTTEQLSVRRLTIFLRKLALREGQRYVFETNNERFRAFVQTYFERILTEILDRGGITAFQVITGAEINTQNDMDNGRFLIAIKFAPTLPIEFITLVLLRSGDDGIDILER